MPCCITFTKAREPAKRGRPKTKDGKIDFSNPDKKQDDPA